MQWLGNSVCLREWPLEFILKIIWKCKRPRIADVVLNKNNKPGDLHTLSRSYIYILCHDHTCYILYRDHVTLSLSYMLHILHDHTCRCSSAVYKPGQLKVSLENDTSSFPLCAKISSRQIKDPNWKTYKSLRFSFYTIPGIEKTFFLVLLLLPTP